MYLTVLFYLQMKIICPGIYGGTVLSLFIVPIHKETFLTGKSLIFNTKTGNKFVKSKYFIVITSTQFRADDQFY